MATWDVFRLTPAGLHAPGGQPLDKRETSDKLIRQNRGNMVMASHIISCHSCGAQPLEALLSWLNR